jgi:ferredoxin
VAVIRLTGDGVEREVPCSSTVSVLNALVRAGIVLHHDCGGKARCGTCRIRVYAGQGRGSGTNPISAAEGERLAAVGAGPEDRLACQLYIYRDIRIEIPFSRP